LEQQLRQLVGKTRRIGNSNAPFATPRHEILQAAKDAIDGKMDDEPDVVLVKPRIKCTYQRLVHTLPSDQKWLKRGLVAFLNLALLILVGAFVAIPYAPNFHERAAIAGSLILAMGTAYMVAEAGGWLRTSRMVAIILIGIISGVFVAWVLTGLFGAVAQVPQNGHLGDV
jgi:hypothetical protein